MRYLLLLYVTLEQEEAISLLYHQHGWQLIKTDLETAKACHQIEETSELPDKNSEADGSERDLGCCHGNLDTTTGDHRDGYPDADQKNYQVEDLSILVDCTENQSTCNDARSSTKNTRVPCKESLSDNSNTTRCELTGTDEDIDKLILDKDTNDLAENIITEENVDSWFNNALEFSQDDAHVENGVGETVSSQTENCVRKVSDTLKLQTQNNKIHKAQMRKTIKMKIEKGKRAFLEKKKKQKDRSEKVNSTTEEIKKNLQKPSFKRTGKKRPIYCVECKRMFTSQKRFDSHKEKNGGQCVFECEYCGKIFLYRKSKYLIHIRSAHTKERPFVCDICNKGYVTSDKLKIHKRTHTGEKPCVCEQCGKAFYSRADLSIHRDYHHNSRENPDDFVCDLCNITFCSKRYLIYHKNVTHSSRRDFNCTLCDKRFKCNAALQRHLRYIHTESRNYKCDLCEKTFKTATCLKKHVVRHGGEKGFFCSYCDKGFYEKAKLVQHVRIHTGEKPFKCDICDFRCALSGNLKKHRKTHYKPL